MHTLQSIWHRCQILIPLSIIPLIMAGCSSSEGNPSNPGSAEQFDTTLPNVGSLYKFDGYNLDTGDVVIESSREQPVWNVTESGIAYQGKSNVYKVHSGGKEFYLRKEANGDLLQASHPDNDSPITSWVTFPFGSKTTFNYPAVDTTALYLGKEARLRITGSIAYVGEENVVVGGETIRAKKVVETMSHVITPEGSNTSKDISVQNTFWYSSKVGYFLKQMSVANGSAFPYYGSRIKVIGELKSYTLK